MESAIDKHLLCPRSRARRVDDDYTPPFPAWVGRADAAITRYVMAYIGVQSKGESQLGAACSALRMIVESLKQVDGPRYHDLAHYRDSDGYDNLIAIAYWDDPAAFERWKADERNGAAWPSRLDASSGLGFFREVITPGVERFETLYAMPEGMEGVGLAMGSRSNEIQEHGYWGSMRDRIPISQTDAMTPSGKLAFSHASDMVSVSGHENLVVIRSGQDWSETQGRERELYLGEMEPVLRAGMDFLRDQGQPVGCYSNRYLRHIDANGQPQEKSFSVSHWRSMSHLERWSESHPTHIEIFGTFLRMVQSLQGELKWKGYHEVSVLRAQDQRYEYLNCHPGTGLMRGI
ncbi:phenylacetaldoxime dehydratase family protein [Pseudomonas sp. PDM18]|uniref:phenylacetaldoxime dehydratase family protein n=1 Tax=Pseudomonas sp. PDM18 TaxID=2769253 RepID=UPI001785B3DA|nr:phenylacetaldoxime dehydratase family protein [Pseudomonas sp. PDM18]MBD9676278.1 phenylacetaldoxime dehydratase family protein [Pseudomonas sp. PDM18]